MSRLLRFPTKPAERKHLETSPITILSLTRGWPDIDQIALLQGNQMYLSVAASMRGQSEMFKITAVVERTSDIPGHTLNVIATSLAKLWQDSPEIIRRVIRFKENPKGREPWELLELAILRVGDVSGWWKEQVLTKWRFDDL